MFKALDYGIIGRAIKKNLVKVNYIDPRQWVQERHGRIDDKSYGGGPGMVIKYQPLYDAIQYAKAIMPLPIKTIYLSPQGQIISQHVLKQTINSYHSLLFIAGRYEGIDERIIQYHVDEEWSLGDLILSGGELAAMVFIDAIIRLIPGCLGNSSSAQQDSFMNGLLDYPHYTRPVVINGLKVPSVLLSGNHQHIELWRRKQSLGKTAQKRPNLLKEIQLTNKDQQLLAEFYEDEKET